MEGGGTGHSQGAELGASRCSGKTSRRPERLRGEGKQAQECGDLRSEGADQAEG